LVHYSMKHTALSISLMRKHIEKTAALGGFFYLLITLYDTLFRTLVKTISLEA
jgi:hypothetical protein